MEEWKKVSLREVTDIIGDGLHGTPLYSSEGEFAFVNGNNLSDGAVEIKADTKMCDLSEYEKYKKDLSDRTLFLSINGTIGNTAKYNGEKIILGKSACYLNVKKDYNLDFIYYVLRTPAFQSAISGLATGTTIKNVSLKTIREYEFSVPDYEVQTRIARILRAIDDKIELNNRINHNLEQQVQALYKSWFVDFEPFRGGKFVDSELGLIPEGWDAKPLSSICHIEKKTINPQKHPTCLFTHYSIPAYDNSELPELQKGSDILSNKYIISDYTILFSKLNPRIKRIWNIYQSESNPICSTEFVVYKPMDIDTYPFLYSFITGDDFYNNIMSKVNGATGSHQRFHPEETLDILVPYHIDCYRLYSQLVLPIIQQIDENKRENHYFSSLRDSLLPKLMSGELKINDLTC